MKKTILAMFMALVGLGFFTSCEKDYTIIFPTWKGFTLNTHSLAPGDTLKITAHLDQPGQWLRSPKYTWTLTIDTIGPSESNVMVTNPCTLRYIAESKPNTITFENGEPVMHDNHIEANADAIGLLRIPENAVKSNTKRQISFNIEYQNSVDATDLSEYRSSVKEGYEGRDFTYRIASTLMSRVSSTFTSQIEIR